MPHKARILLMLGLTKTKDPERTAKNVQRILDTTCISAIFFIFNFRQFPRHRNENKLSTEIPPNLPFQREELSDSRLLT